MENGLPSRQMPSSHYIKKENYHQTQLHPQQPHPTTSEICEVPGPNHQPQSKLGRTHQQHNQHSNKKSQLYKKKPYHLLNNNQGNCIPITCPPWCRLLSSCMGSLRKDRYRTDRKNTKTGCPIR